MRRLQRCCALMCLCDQLLISGLWPHAGGLWSTARHGLRLHCRHNLLLGAPSLTSFGNMRALSAVPLSWADSHPCTAL